LALPVPLCLVQGACDAGPGILTGVDEPMRVSGGQFIQGDLPGSPPPPASATATAAGDGGLPPLTVKAVNYSGSNVIQPGQAAKSFSGDVTLDAIAVGAKLEGLGTGYWVVPAGAVDQSDTTAYTFSLPANFSASDPPGLRNLLVVAIGPSGQAGVQNATPLCLVSRIPDNNHACIPKNQAPSAVFTLQWDTNFDLDLHVRTPDGIDFNPRQPYGETIEAGTTVIPPDLPHFDRDSLANCVPDGLNQEDLIFQNPPSKGTYTIYVDPFDSCGQNIAHFTFTLYRTTGTCPDCTQAAVSTVSGEVLASQVSGGNLVPLKIAQVSF
jgi:hypothetical protein